MSRRGRRRQASRDHHHPQHHQRVTSAHPAIDEPEETLESSPGLAMSLASAECIDDRPDVPIGNSVLPRGHRVDPPIPPGVLLRERREERGLSLDDLWRTTKINKSTLHAIEESDLAHLPAPIYTRGFVKAYAHEVGLNPETTADEYLRRLEPLRLVQPVDVSPAPAVASARAVERKYDSAQIQMAANHARRFSRVLTVAAAVGLIIYLVSVSSRTDDPIVTAPIEEPGDAVPAGPAQEPPAVAADAATAAFDDGPIRVELVTRAQCWVSARVDGERVVAKLLQPGERHTLEITDEAVLRVGEPGALTVSINGQLGRPLGPAGQPVTVRITRDNFRDFLSS